MFPVDRGRIFGMLLTTGKTGSLAETRKLSGNAVPIPERETHHGNRGMQLRRGDL